MRHSMNFPHCCPNPLQFPAPTNGDITESNSSAAPSSGYPLRPGAWQLADSRSSGYLRPTATPSPDLHSAHTTPDSEYQRDYFPAALGPPSSLSHQFSDLTCNSGLSQTQSGVDFRRYLPSKPFQSQPVQSTPFQSQTVQSTPLPSQPFQSTPLRSQPFQSQSSSFRHFRCPIPTSSFLGRSSEASNGTNDGYSQMAVKGKGRGDRCAQAQFSEFPCDISAPGPTAGGDSTIFHYDALPNTCKSVGRGRQLEPVADNFVLPTAPQATNCPLSMPKLETTFQCTYFREMGKRFPFLSMNERGELLDRIHRDVGSDIYTLGVQSAIDVSTRFMERQMQDELDESDDSSWSPYL